MVAILTLESYYKIFNHSKKNGKWKNIVMKMTEDEQKFWSW